jgi:hypothetical protein
MSHHDGDGAPCNNAQRMPGRRRPGRGGHGVRPGDVPRGAPPRTITLDGRTNATSRFREGSPAQPVRVRLTYRVSPCLAETQWIRRTNRPRPTQTEAHNTPSPNKSERPHRSSLVASGHRHDRRNRWPRMVALKGSGSDARSSGPFLCVSPVCRRPTHNAQT